jgi:hypothetical protein
VASFPSHANVANDANGIRSEGETSESGDCRLSFLGLSCRSLCLNEQVLDPKPFGQHRQHFSQILHPQGGSPDCLRSTLLRMMGIDTQTKDACVPINRHSNFDFALPHGLRHDAL